MSKKLKALVTDSPAAHLPELPKPAPSLTAAELRAKVEEELRTRSQACYKELVEVLKKYNCRIQTRPVIQDGLIGSEWGVWANE